ncbi:MAG: OmpA family protein [Candidatus Sulfotelmatobacter sp.]
MLTSEIKSEPRFCKWHSRATRLSQKCHPAIPLQELGKLPNKISLEGHTDSKLYATSGNYGNWELSSDRANAARRLMQAKGLGTT